MLIRPIKITIANNTAQLRDRKRIQDILAVDDYDDDSEMPEEEPVVFVSDGVIIKDGKTVKISYDENELVGMQGAHTVLAFNEDEPTMVSMLRSGSITTALTFNSVDTRQLCVYNAGQIPFEVAVCTDALSNTVTYKTGGEIHAEYTIEIKGVPVEYNRLSVIVANL